VEVAIVETRPVAVINLAYLLADACEGNLDGAFQINVVGSQNIIEACRRHQVPRLVYASSIAVYGNQADWGNRLITETDRGTPVRLYGWHKLLQDQIAAEYFRQGLSCVGLRMSTIFGPGRKAGLSAAINSLIYPDIGNQTVSLPWSEDEAFDLIHVEDIAESIVALVRIQELEWSLANSGGEYATIGQLISNIRTLRPDICVDLPSQPRTLAHCSRIDWSRLRAILGHDRQRLTQRQIAGAGNAV
jgi:UDP-glucose 4-epimerase